MHADRRNERIIVFSILIKKSLLSSNEIQIFKRMLRQILLTNQTKMMTVDKLDNLRIVVDKLTRFKEIYIQVQVFVPDFIANS